MKLLDCESVETALSTLASILEQQEIELTENLSQVNLDDVDHDNRGEFLWCQVTTLHPLSLGVEVFHWFHATRVIDCSTFLVNGLLSLPQMYPLICNELTSLVEQGPGEIEVAFAQDFDFDGPADDDNNVHWKLHSKSDHGPFGFLARELALTSGDRREHDYCGCPEIIEDICDNIAAKHPAVARQIRVRFAEQARPCIVKFRAPAYSAKKVLEDGLLYTYNSLTGRPHGLYLGFNGLGNSIPASEIVYAEFVDDPANSSS